MKLSLFKFALLPALALLLPISTFAAAAKAASKNSKTAKGAEEAAPDDAAGKAASMGKDKAGIEAYLKERLNSIRARHKAQVDFNSDEDQQWQEFWNKIKEERELFEVRVAKQRLNVFESLDSLEKAEHGKTLADFERMQSNVLKSFETAQRAKMTAFFAAQGERMKSFAARQEKERVSFAEDAEASWRQLKADIPAAAAARP